MDTQSNSFVRTLVVIFLVTWVYLAFDVFDRTTWVVENVIMFLGAIYLIASYKKEPFSNNAYFLIFIFCLLQTVGAHYTYALVPAGDWVSDILGIERNHYDRLVHFTFGFLLALPLIEILKSQVNYKNTVYKHLLIVLIFLGFGGLYEVIEWMYAWYNQGNEASDAFLGSQGDIWDAQKDIFLAGLGAWLYLLFFTPKTQQ
jgi:putative membrane protein